MPLALDTIALGVPEVEAAHAFYAAAFPAAADGGTGVLDLNGTGLLALHPAEALAAEAGTTAASSGFRGCVLSCVVERPAEVRTLFDAAAAAGAAVVKPPKKGLFGEFIAVFRAPDGAVWKLAAATKDAGPAAGPPAPSETGVLLGVAAPKASKVFYEALGMRADHDYGDKFIDFAADGGASRLGLLRRRALAKDAGVAADGDGFTGLVLTRTAADRHEVDALLAAAAAAGGRVTAAAARTGTGAYAGRCTDPDGHHWRIAAAE